MSSIMDRTPSLAELVEPALLLELCQTFSDLYRVGVRILDRTGRQLVDVDKGRALTAILFENAEARRMLVKFIADLKRIELAPAEDAVREETICGTRYLLMPIVYEHTVFGTLVCGPYLPQNPRPLISSPLARGLDVPALAAERKNLRSFAEASLKSRLTFLLRSLDVACHTGYRALLTSNMHLESITKSYNDLTTANQALRERNEALATTNEQLRELDGLKSNFLATVSHELRTPLTAVIGYGEMLREEMAGPINDEQREYVDTIVERGKNLLHLISGILDISKIERDADVLALSEVNLETLVEDVLSTVRPQAIKGNVKLASQIDGVAQVLPLDHYKIRQSLVNLLGNAVKFTPPNGQVSLSVSPSHEAVLFTVRDSGIGMAPSELEKIFEAFYQVDNTSTRKYGGTGLGLSIVKHFIDAHGGQIGVSSAPGQGSTFTLTIPIDATEASQIQGPG